jgi:serine/threonine protein kinase
MGAVFRAHDPQLERDVAVKLISLAAATGQGDPKEAAARFAREARVAARLHHPNVVTVFDFGEEGDQLYLVMELVAGETLAQRMARGDFPGTTAALEIVAQAADALASAHRAGVIHRDIKPGNLLLAASGGVKVSDFGVAKAVGESTELTRTGMMVGSPAYMAPEQVQGLDLDGRSDLFSLGVVLYEMLLHRKPFPADTLTTLVYQILHQDPFESATVAGRLHPDLIDLLRWSLDKERDARIPDAQTFAARARALIAQFARGGGASPAAPSRPAASSQPPLAPAAAGSGSSTTQGESFPAPLPPASYATSAPTEIVSRRAGRQRPWQRWAPWIGAGLLLAALVAGLVLKQPSPPPDLAQAPGSNGSNGGGSPLVSGPMVATTGPGSSVPAVESAMAAPVPVAETPTLAAGQRVEQALPPAAPPKPAPVGPAPVAATPPTGGAAQEAQAAADEAAAEEATPAPPAAAAPPPIAKVFQCRRGAEFHVDPEEVLVTIDGRLLGKADDWDGAGGGDTYFFPGPGDYLVQLSLEGFRTVWVKVVVTPSARRDVVDIDTELEEID